VSTASDANGRNENTGCEKPSTSTNVTHERRRGIQTGVRANVDLQCAVAGETLLTVATSVLVVRVLTASAR